jgi:hypothetical protein
MPATIPERAERLSDPRDTPVSVETVEGHRPSTTVGDRMMIGLAAVALVGGALIGVSKLLPGKPDSSIPSATAVASATRRATPTSPADVLRTFQLNGEAPSTVARQPAGWQGWIRAVRRIKILGSPSQSAATLAVLQPGDAAWISDDTHISEWIHVEAPVSGFIPKQRAAEPNAIRFGQHPLDVQSGVESIVAGPDGQFLATGWSSQDYGSYVLGITHGGNEWELVDAPEMLEGITSFRAAYGPSGWIAVSTSLSDEQPLPWIWQSDDGANWQRLGALGDLPIDGIGPLQLAGSPQAYVMTALQDGFPRGSAPGSPRILYSADGIVWSERPTVAASDRVVSSGLGFYAYVADETRQHPAAFSEDGWDWSLVDTGEMRPLVGVAGSGGGWVALERVGTVIRTWIARVENGRLVWHHDLATEGEFEDAVVTAIAGGATAVAMGWERGSESALWWSNDEAGWHRHRLPAAFGAFPSTGAAAEHEYVLAGSGSSPLGGNPVLWSSAGFGTLRPETHPFIDGPGSLSAAACAEYDTDLLTLLGSSPLAQAVCRGDAPITTRAYIPRCDGCDSGSEPTSIEPAWLAQPSADRVLRLSPIDDGDWSWLEAILDPSLRYRPGWEGHWVTVTGHFDDPAAATCRMEPRLEEELWYPGHAQVVRDCRGRFVVTSVSLES